MGIEEVIKKYMDEEYAFIEINKNYNAAIRNYVYNECRGWPAFIEEAKAEKRRSGILFCEADVRCIKLKEEYRRLLDDLSISEIEELINKIQNGSLSLDDNDMVKIYRNVINDLNRIIEERRENSPIKNRV